MTPSLLVFVMLYFYSFMMVMSSDDWFLVWFGLEVNMLSFLFLIFRQGSVSLSESCMKYFFIQSMGSVMFVCMVYMLDMSYNYLVSVVLGYKLGIGPFFFWFPSIIEGVGWFGGFLLMSIQKVIPLMLLVMFMSWVIWVLVMVSLVVGVLGSFNQSKCKILFAYSSIHHMGWMLMCELVDKGIWLIYLLMYAVALMLVVMLVYNYNINEFMEVWKLRNSEWLVMSFLGIAGMPPMLGFFLKWMAFMYFLKVSYIMLIYMIIMSVIMMYVYIRVVYDVIMGGMLKASWYSGSYMSLFVVSMDFVMVLSTLLGVMVGLVLVL